MGNDTKVVMTTSSFCGAVLGVSILKLLLLNSYRSTDFEVHRNWLAITHSLPLEKWYYERTSEWTLDYPPFFAYFQWVLSQAAQFFDPKMLLISNLNYASSETVLFQKLSVIMVDLLLAFSVVKCSSSSSFLQSRAATSPFNSRKAEFSVTNGIPLGTLFILIFLNGGLFLVDHIHFQYNGFLFGMLLLSISKSLEGKYYQSAFLFAALLNFKHIFLYMAPAFGLYFLRRQCFPPSKPIRFITLFQSILSFGVIGVSVFALSFGPFYAHIPQILKRLFPFQRGLSHAYWAPNVWAAYNTIDWGLNILLNKTRTTSGVTSGLVGTTSLSYLPQILPLHTFLLTLLFMTPSLYKLWKSPNAPNFVRSVILTAWTSFMFGYHVHEKAILNVILPFSLISFQEPNLYFLTLATGTASLFPLLFTPTEIVLKAVIAVLHLSLVFQVLPLRRFPVFHLIYLVGFIFVYLIENLGSVLLPNYPFLPLMLVSDYCLLGIGYCYLSFYWNFIFPSSQDSPQRVTNSPISSPKTTLNGTVKSSPPQVISPSSPLSRSSRGSPQSASTSANTSTSNSFSRKVPSRKQIPTSDRVLRKRN